MVVGVENLRCFAEGWSGEEGEQFSASSQEARVGAGAGGVIDSYNSQQSRLDSQFQDSDLVKDTAFPASLAQNNHCPPPSPFFSPLTSFTRLSYFLE